MFINKQESVLFEDEELDAICAGIETIFSEFFKEDETYLVVSGICFNKSMGCDIADEVIRCLSHLSTGVRGIIDGSAIKINLQEFYKFIAKDDNKPHFHYSLYYNNKGLLVGSIGLELEMGKIFCYCGIDKTGEDEMVRYALCGLALLLCKIMVLSRKSEWAQELLERISASDFIDSAMSKVIKKRIDEIL